MKNVFPTIVSWALLWCPLVQTMDKKKEFEKLQKLQIFKQLHQHNHDKKILSNELKKFDSKDLKEQFDVDASYLNNMQIPMLHEPKNTQVQESSSWSLSSINPLNAVWYLWSTQSVKNFDWENPYKINYEKYVYFHSGYKNFIEDASGPRKLYDVALRKKVFSSNGYFSTEDNNSCFYSQVEDGRGGYKVDVYDAKQDKRFGMSSGKKGAVYTFGSDDLRFVTQLNDKELEVTYIRGSVGSKTLKKDGYVINFYIATDDGIVIVYKNDTEQRMVFYDIKNNYREIEEVTTNKVFVLLRTIFPFKPKDKFVVMVDDEIQVYAIKTGKLLYKHKTTLGDDLFNWDLERTFSRFVVWDFSGKHDYIEIHDLDKNKMFTLKHDVARGHVGTFPVYNYCISESKKWDYIVYRIDSGKELTRLSLQSRKDFRANDRVYEITDTDFSVYDLRKEHQLILEKHDGSRREPYGSRLVVLSQNKKNIYLCDVDTLQERKKELDQTIVTMILDSQERLLTTGHEKKVNIFETSTLKLIKSIEVEGTAQKMQYSRDGNFFVVYQSEYPKNLLIYDAAHGYELLKKLEFNDAVLRTAWHETLIDFDDTSTVMGVKTEKEFLAFTAKELLGK